MNNYENNHNELNSAYILRSGYATAIDNQIENLKISQFTEKPFQSKTSEVSKIINCKTTSSIENTNLNINSANKNNITLPEFLMSNNKTNIKSNIKSNLTDSVKYYSIGNRNLNINTFKTLLKKALF